MRGAGPIPQQELELGALSFSQPLLLVLHIQFFLC